MTICHVFTHSKVTRGGAVQGLSLAQRQYEKGHKVVCFFHKPYREVGEDPFLKTLSFPVIRVNMKNPLSYVWFARWMQAFSPQVVHCHRNLGLLFAFFSIHFTGLKLTHQPVIVINRGTTYNLPNFITRYVFRSPFLDHIIAVSEAVKESLVKSEHIAPSRISVVYGSYDDRIFSPSVKGEKFREEMGLSPTQPLIVSIAAVDKRKGLEFFLKAAAFVKTLVGDALFLSVGVLEDKGYYEKLLRLRRELHLDDVFRFLGHRNDVAEILAACDVAVSSSTEGEGLTGSIREAMALKKPVVATMVSGNPEVVIDGMTGWLVPPGDDKALAKAILEVLCSKEEAERRALRGYNLIKELCSLERRYERILDIYEKLIKNKYKQPARSYKETT